MADQWAEFADAWDEFQDADAATGTSGGPVGPRRRNTRGQQVQQREMGVARGQGEMLKGVADIGVNSLLNAPNDVGNALVNVGAAAIDPYASVVTKLLGRGPTNLEERARANPVFGRAPLMTEAGERGVEAVAEMVPEPVQRFLSENPLAGDIATVAGGAVGARASGLLPKGPVLNEFSRNVARNRGAAPYQQSPVADVAQRYTVVPEDVQHSAGMANAGDIRGSTRASLGPDVTGSEVPVANIRKATANAVSDMPAPGGLLDANGRVDAGLLRKAMDEQSVPYQQVAQLPAPQANTLAGRLRQAWEARGGSLKGDAVAESRLLPLMDEAGAPLPTGELLSRWKEINGYAASLRKQVGEGSAAAQIKSGDLRLIADAILDEVDSRAAAFANPQLTESLKQARVNLGRLHSLEDALDTVGWVDPAKLKAMGERGVPLSGGLAQVAADVAAAPRSLRPMQSAINAQDSALDQFGRQPNSWLRNVAGHVGGNWLARRGVDSLNRELRAGRGALRQPVPETPVPLLYGPNAGPQPPAPVPQAPPGLFAAEPPAPRTPLLPDAGRPAPGELPFNQRLAELMAGDLQLEGQVPRGSVPPAPSTRPLDVIDFEPVEAPAAPGTVLPALTQEQLRLAPKDPLSLVDAPAPSFAAALDEGIPFSTTGAGRGIEGDFASQLGPVRAEPGIADFELGAMTPGMPDRPRGVSGPRSAQLGGRSPRDFPLLPDDEPGPLGPLFGPDDEFPPPAAPVLPQGPAPSGAGGGAISDMLYRGVPEGADPMAPNSRNFTTWSNRRPTAERYGPTVGEMPLNEAEFPFRGTLEELRAATGAGPDATAQDIAALLLQQEPELRGFAYDLRPELDGTPREFIRRGDAQPAPAGVSNLLARYDNQDGGEFPWMSDDEFLRELADSEGVPPAVKSKVDEYLERRESDYREDAGRGDSDEFAEQTIQAVRRLLGG